MNANNRSVEVAVVAQHPGLLERLHALLAASTGRAKATAGPCLEKIQPKSGGAFMLETRDLLAELRAFNEVSAFNRWSGIEIASAAPGFVEITMPWRKESAQYSGFLHAGLIAALIDTACGYAAETIVGPVLAAHFSVNCLRPATGERFVARAKVVRTGKTQVFTACELFALASAQEHMVATGKAIPHRDSGRALKPRAMAAGASRNRDPSIGTTHADIRGD